MRPPEIRRPTFSEKVWAGGVVAPMALMMAWGFGFEQNQATSPVFKPMTALVPFEAWAMGWAVCGALAVAASISQSSFLCFRLQLVTGWALMTGLLISVLWAKYVDDAAVTLVGVSWVYFLWATFGYVAMRSANNRADQIITAKES